MTFGQSISTCFAKYATFKGRASRSEFWWFILFSVLGSAAIMGWIPRSGADSGTALTRISCAGE